MAKKFAPRISKKKRATIDMSDILGASSYRLTEEPLLKGAKLSEIELKSIRVKEQVRTKFNESSLRDLAANIKNNGLIQPLVLYKSRGRYVLICGERRFRAMGLIKMKKAPCFILENKSDEELMAIQFSENSAREELHYIDKADGILNYQKATKDSERKIVAALGISKSEVHRSLLIARLPNKIREAAKKFNIEKYVLVEFNTLEGALKKRVEKDICSGELVKRAELKKLIKSTGTLSVKKTTKAKAASKGLSAAEFVKAMNAQAKSLDPESRKLLKLLMKETSGSLKE